MADKVDGSVRPVDDPAMLDLVMHEPIGVCALLLAWNSPMQLLANKLPPALAAGNTVVVRPSELAPTSVARFGELVCESEIPPGVVNVITGRDRRTGERLVRHRDVDLVSVTGGVATGRTVAGSAGHDLKRVIAELGGKSAQLIFADADIPAAVEGVVAGVFAAAGQTCVAGSRLLVERTVFDDVISRIVDRAERMRLGDPFDEATDIGPMANEAQHRRVLARIDEGVAAGARLLTGGRDARTHDLFIPPTIFTDVGEASALFQEEIFGPVVVAMPFEDEDAAVRAANATPYGLAAGLWTADLSRALRVAKRLQCGTVWVNTFRRVEASAPFGGVKQSGLGRERGREGLREFMQPKNVMIRIAP
jgi:aldehyde dehydrogenase (NAD+)